MKKLLALLLLLPAVSFGAVAVDGTPVAGNAVATTITISVTCATAGDILVYLEGSGNGGGTTLPSGITYNGTSLTMLTGSNILGTVMGSSIWYLLTPSTGAAHNLVVTYPLAYYGAGEAVCIKGAASSSTFGTPATAHGTTASAALTVTGSGGSGDLYIAGVEVFYTALTSGGTNGQTRLAANLSVGTTTSSSGDDIPGANTGGFTWTGSGGTGGDTTASGVVIHAAAGGSTYVGPGGFALSPSN